MGLLANLKKMQAQDTIHRGAFDAENIDLVGQLFLQAFGRPELAQRAKTEAAELKVNNQTGTKGF